MAQPNVPKRVFSPAKTDAATARSAPPNPQTAHPAYRLAFQDPDFLLREDLRPVRFQLELLKPELLLDEAEIGSTLVFYGSAMRRWVSVTAAATIASALSGSGMRAEP